MNAQELAARLDGIEYPRDGLPADLVAEARAAGLVIVYGMSDDLVEFEGAIWHEVDAYEGVVVSVDSKGFTPPWITLCEPHARRLAAIWCPEDLPGYSWKIEADFPSAPFLIVDDGEPYCRGLVFAMTDLAPPVLEEPAAIGPEMARDLLRLLWAIDADSGNTNDWVDSVCSARKNFNASFESLLRRVAGYPKSPPSVPRYRAPGLKE